MKRVVSMLALGAVAFATVPSARAGDGFDLEVWQPTHDGSGAVTTRGVEVLDAWDVRAGLSVDYARKPLRLVAGGAVIAPLMRSATTGDLGVTLGLPYNFETEVSLPVSHHVVINPLAADGSNGVTATGVGDTRALLKWRGFQGGDYLPGVGAFGGLLFPTGNGTSWFGSNSVEGIVGGIAEERAGPFGFYGNLGSRIRPRTATVWGKRVGSSMLGNLGATWDTGFFGMTLLADGYGSYAFRSKEAPFEVGGGARRDIVPGATLTVGANHGIGHALGTPTYRVYGMLSVDSSLFHRRHAPIPIVRATPIATPTPEAMHPIARSSPGATPVPATTPWLDTPTPAPTPVVRLSAETPQVIVEEKRLDLNQSIHFALDLYEIRKDSYPILEEVAQAMVEHPEIKLLRVEGHTDSSGPDALNDALSKLRAVSVKNFLVKHGVAESRIESAGYGPHKPIASNRSKEGRALNRRVEFNILDREMKAAPVVAPTPTIAKPTATPAATAIPMETPLPLETPVPTPKPAASATPKPKPAATAKPKPAATAKPAASATPKPASSGATAAGTPKPAPTPTPGKASPVPTKTPAP